MDIHFVLNKRGMKHLSPDTYAVLNFMPEEGV